MKFPLEDTDFYDYFPLRGGEIPVSSARINKLPYYTGRYATVKNSVFQKDDLYSYTINSKRKLESGSQDFAAIDEEPEYYQSLAVNLQSLLEGSPYSIALHSDKYDLKRLFSKTQEDAILIREIDGSNYVSAVYLGCPNDWSAKNALGVSFEDAHKNIHDIKKKIPNLSRLFKAMLKSNHMFERVGAINFRVSPNLNRIDSIPDYIRCRNFNKNFPSLWCRFERQVVVPMHDINSVLLTVKTYQFNCKHPDLDKREDVIKAITDFKPNIHAFSYLSDNKEEILKWLKS